MNLKDWLKGLVTSVDPFLNVAQRLIQSWYSTGKEIPPARRPRMVWQREPEASDICTERTTGGGLRQQHRRPAEKRAPVPLWSGEWVDRGRYPGVLLRTIRKWWVDGKDDRSGYELGWARQLAIGAA